MEDKFQVFSNYSYLDSDHLELLKKIDSIYFSNKENFTRAIKYFTQIASLLALGHFANTSEDKAIIYF